MTTYRKLTLAELYPIAYQQDLMKKQAEHFVDKIISNGNWKETSFYRKSLNPNQITYDPDFNEVIDAIKKETKFVDDMSQHTRAINYLL